MNEKNLTKTTRPQNKRVTKAELEQQIEALREAEKSLRSEFLTQKEALENKLFSAESQLRVFDGNVRELDNRVKQLETTIDYARRTIETRLIVTYQTELWPSCNSAKETVVGEEVRFLRHLHGLL